MSTFAIIESGGKQYRVAASSKVKVESLPGNSGEAVVFDRVLMKVNGDEVRIGTPYLTGEAVKGTVVRQGRDDKKIIFRYHSKTRYRKLKGHRQHFTEVEIAEI